MLATNKRTNKHPHERFLPRFILRGFEVARRALPKCVARYLDLSSSLLLHKHDHTGHELLRLASFCPLFPLAAV